MIEIDDAGIGSLYGGVSIVVNAGEEYRVSDIGLGFFKEKARRGLYQEIYMCIRYMLESLGIGPEEGLRVCRGIVFNYACKELEKEGFEIERGKIEGETQELAEACFNSYLKRLGIPVKEGSHGMSYNSMYERLKREKDFHLAKQLWKPVKKLMSQ